MTTSHEDGPQGRRLLVDHYPGEAILWSDIEPPGTAAEQDERPEDVRRVQEPLP